MSNQSQIPQGFEQYPLDQSFNDALSPLYFSITQEAASWGLIIEKHHSNPLGICHGGVLMTLMDFALSAAVCHGCKKFTAMPTISMSLDFLAPGKLGSWIWLV